MHTPMLVGRVKAIPLNHTLEQRFENVSADFKKDRLLPAWFREDPFEQDPVAVTH